MHLAHRDIFGLVIQRLGGKFRLGHNDILGNEVFQAELFPGKGHDTFYHSLAGDGIVVGDVVVHTTVLLGPINASGVHITAFENIHNPAVLGMEDKMAPVHFVHLPAQRKVASPAFGFVCGQFKVVRAAGAVAAVNEGVVVNVEAGSGNKQVGYYEYNKDSEGFAPATIIAKTSALTLPEGYSWLATATAGEYEVGVAVASITKDGVTTNYASLAEAIAAATADDTVVLLQDTKVEYLTVDKKITLNLNGKEVTSDKSNLFEVKSAGDLTITGNGKITGPADGQNFDSNALIMVNGGKLNIENGTLTATGSGSDGMYGVYVLDGGTAVFGTAATQNEEASGPSITSHFAAIGTNHTTSPANITIHGGAYTANAVPGDSTTWWHYFCAPIYAAAAGTFTVNGGTFNGYYGVSTRYDDFSNGQPQTITVNGGTFTVTSNTQIFVDNVDGGVQGGVHSNNYRTIAATINTLTVPTGYIWANVGT